MNSLAKIPEKYQLQYNEFNTLSFYEKYYKLIYILSKIKIFNPICNCIYYAAIEYVETKEELYITELIMTLITVFNPNTDADCKYFYLQYFRSTRTQLINLYDSGYTILHTQYDIIKGYIDNESAINSGAVNIDYMLEAIYGANYDSEERLKLENILNKLFNPSFFFSEKMDDWIQNNIKSTEIGLEIID